MTPKERAKECTWKAGGNDWGRDDQEELEADVEAAIIAAVEDERAAWQPIDTAPKDGTWILLRGKNSVGRPMIPVVAAWRYERDCYGWYDSGNLKKMFDVDISPEDAKNAEWMPLPS